MPAESSSAGTVMVGSASASPPSSKVRRAASAACVGRGAAVEEGGRLGRQHLLGLVDLAAVKRLQARDLVHRQLGVELEEAADVGVLGVAPELPVLVGRQEVGVEPDGALRGLAHLGARRGGEQRAGQRIELREAHAPAEVDAVDDVAPLVGAADLQACSRSAG